MLRGVDPFERFIAKVVAADNGCWLWTASLDTGGYGNFRLNGRLERAHRYAYMAFVGWIGDGLSVLHKCDVRRCVNPDHLFLGTDKDNSDDMMAKKRNRQPRGVGNAAAKLTEGDVIAIRASNARQVDLAAMYGISRDQVHNIRTLVHWKHVS